MSLLAERAEFMLRFLEEPAKIGSITPSSMFLARKMLGELPWPELDTIVELGAGTGVFTGYISQHKQKSAKTLVVEQDRSMRKTLRERYPEFFYGTRAEELPALLRYFNLPQADCVISGLPFATFSKEERNQVLLAVSQSLKTNGVFVAFQYSLQMRSLVKKYFREVRIRFAPLNFPPAFIYYCKK